MRHQGVGVALDHELRGSTKPALAHTSVVVQQQAKLLNVSAPLPKPGGTCNQRLGQEKCSLRRRALVPKPLLPLHRVGAIRFAQRQAKLQVIAV
eukprot:779619-Pleurochrysis_carterae.AAC.1